MTLATHSEDFPTEIDTAGMVTHASAVVFSLAILYAIRVKVYWDSFLPHAGGSVIERCRERQRKFDSLEKWPFYHFLKLPTLTFQFGAFLLLCAFFLRVWCLGSLIGPICALLILPVVVVCGWMVVVANALS